MIQASINNGDNKDRQPRGLKDRGHIVVRCTSCKRDLLDIQVTANNSDLLAMGLKPTVTKLACQCGFCSGTSEVHEISGSFAPGVISDKHFMTFVGEYDGLQIFRAGKRS